MQKKPFTSSTLKVFSNIKGISSNKNIKDLSRNRGKTTFEKPDNFNEFISNRDKDPSKLSSKYNTKGNIGSSDRIKSPDSTNLKSPISSPKTTMIKSPRLKSKFTSGNNLLSPSATEKEKKEGEKHNSNNFFNFRA